MPLRWFQGVLGLVPDEALLCNIELFPYRETDVLPPPVPGRWGSAAES